MNHSLIQRPVSITQETPRGGGLDSFPKKNKKTKLYVIVIYLASSSPSNSIQLLFKQQRAKSLFIPLLSKQFLFLDKKFWSDHDPSPSSI